MQIYNYVEARVPWRQVPLRCPVDFTPLTIYSVELENVVEFKSLPSGLHNVREDLVYVVFEHLNRDSDDVDTGFAGILSTNSMRALALSSINRPPNPNEMH